RRREGRLVGQCYGLRLVGRARRVERAVERCAARGRVVPGDDPATERRVVARQLAPGGDGAFVHDDARWHGVGDDEVVAGGVAVVGDDEAVGERLTGVDGVGLLVVDGLGDHQLRAEQGDGRVVVDAGAGVLVVVHPVPGELGGVV